MDGKTEQVGIGRLLVSEHPESGERDRFGER